MNVSRNQVLKDVVKGPIVRALLSRIFVAAVSVASTYIAMLSPEFYANFCQVM